MNERTIRLSHPVGRNEVHPSLYSPTSPGGPTRYTEKCYLCSCGQSEFWIAPGAHMPEKVAAFKERHAGHGVLVEVTPDVHVPMRVV